jgi:hypothetical protein
VILTHPPKTMSRYAQVAEATARNRTVRMGGKSLGAVDGSKVRGFRFRVRPPTLGHAIGTHQ